MSGDCSDDSASTSVTSESDAIRESDEEFIENGSDVGTGAEGYRNSATTSAGSSEYWEDDDDDEDNGDQQDAIEAHDEHIKVSSVLDVMSQHEPSMASLTAVVYSLKVDMDPVASDGRGGEAEISEDGDCSTSK